MFSYADDLEGIRPYIFQYNFLLRHSKSVFRFAVPCIRMWVGYFGMLPLPTIGKRTKCGRSPEWF